ncbi:LysR family transcriptional regulator [Sphingopyxis granuli]|uniref:LysR-type activator n=1 Tax=Sphingopyxis granuli TaxID=267128 RepID=A0AA86GRX8_9SPHN|nr:LysR family transcriptional regulator [Sphingopyxis granuli]AMG75153.1 LysR-type activator [Sphingopyxis granuli]
MWELIDLLKLDLNLLRIFHRMMVDRKVSAAAEALGITQPGVSNALKRLRDITDDELFTRAPGGMEPTAFAIQIAEPISYALAMVDAAFTQPTDFKPASDRRLFRLGLTDIGEAYLLPKILARTAEIAPHVSFTTIRPPKSEIREEMEVGSLDLAIDVFPNMKGNFVHRRLLKEKHVICMRKDHPLANKAEWTMADYIAQEHVVVIAQGTGHGDIDALLARKGISRNIRLMLPHFLSLGPVMHATNLVATLPEDAALLLEEPYELISLPFPGILPIVHVDVFWHRRLHRDPANVWLRNLVYELFSKPSD